MEIDNVLLASVVSKHIYNYIYLLKLRNKHEENLIKDDIKLNTMLENR